MFQKRACLICLVLVLGVFSSCWGQGKDPNLVGWWNFDEGGGSDVFDLSTYANHGTLQGDPQWTLGMISIPHRLLIR